MRSPRPAHVLLCLSLASGLVPVAALAQPAASPAGQDAPLQQVALTQTQIDGLVKAHKDIGAIEAKIPDSAQGAPDPHIVAQLDAAAKKYGFANYADYQNVGQTAAMVMSGFDVDTKTYIGPTEALKKQIAEVEADKTMSAADKKQAVAELNDSLQAAGAMKPTQANIDLVGKNLDKLSELFQQDD